MRVSTLSGFCGILIGLTLAAACSDSKESNTLPPASTGGSGGSSVEGGVGGNATGSAGTDSEPPSYAEGPVPGRGPQTLREAADAAGRLIGVALNGGRMGNSAYTAAAAGEFSYMTHENELKWDQVEPTQGNFTFANADRLVDFAEASGMKIKGHTLVWHSQLASWVKALTTREEVLGAMENHIREIVGRYRGRVHAWDVVNEAFTDGQSRLRGTDPADNSPANAQANAGTNGPDSIFARLIGPEYIDRAFVVANEADPDALLFYNDYNGEGDGSKSDAIYALVQGMLARGVPIHGVGMQAHLALNSGANRAPDRIAANIKRLAALGIDVQLTELDIVLCVPNSPDTLEQRRVQQRQRFLEVAKACLDEPRCTAITMWGVGDSNSWRDADCATGGRTEPLLFDLNYARKDAYLGVFQALAEAAPQPAGE
jgi:endo-1,4-beta-xylanase